MSEIHLSCDRGPGTLTKALPPRFLEDSDGIVRLYKGITVVGELSEKPSITVCCADGIEWQQWYIQQIRWSRLSALLLLQGGSLQDLVGERYVLLRGKVSPVYAEVPVFEEVELAEVLKVNRQLTHREFYDFLQGK